MRCIFCDKDIFKVDTKLGAPVTLPARGVAHSVCATHDLMERRVFGSIELADLSEQDLYELRELVLTEINLREGNNSEEVDLF